MYPIIVQQDFYNLLILYTSIKKKNLEKTSFQVLKKIKKFKFCEWSEFIY